MLRDCLRAVGVVPILMSTHSGSHNALPQGVDSRSATDGPGLWCRLITKLPRFHSQHPFSNAFQLSTERPLVHNLVQGKPDLASSVTYVRDYFQRSKRQAWTADPVFQLCQLFRSRQEKDYPSASAHRLVGVHFGHFEATTKDLQRQDFFGRQGTLTVGKVRLPTPEEEPILFLALTTWKADELAEKKPLFPLVDSTGNPVSVRTVLNRSHCFSPAIDTQNPNAMKLSGDHLEVLALAALTLASLRCDDGFLAGNSLFRFVATVSLLLSASGPTKERLDRLEENVAMQFQGLGSFSTIRIPAAASSDSSLCEDIHEFAVAELKRPADAERRDGSMTLGKTKEAVLHIECQNNDRGVPTKIVEKVVARMRLNFKTTFLFASKVNGLWSDEESMGQFFDDMNLEPSKLYVLVVPPTQQPTWLKSISGQCFQPGPSNTGGHLLVVFEVGKVEAT